MHGSNTTCSNCMSRWRGSLSKKHRPLYVCTHLFPVFLIHHFSLIMTNIFGGHATFLFKHSNVATTNLFGSMLSPLTLDNYSRTKLNLHANNTSSMWYKYTNDQHEIVFSCARNIPPTPPHVTKAL
jgi:hypothetical protein